MNPDKNYNILEKHLKILGQKIRLDILTKLDNYIEPMPYSVLQKEVLGPNINATNFSFHLKTLKKHNLIESTDNGYSLSKLGKQILQKIVSIEQILSEQKNPLMIRTSKYSKEPFDTDKIEEYLIKEGKLERDLSKKIAREVEERLSKTNITYLTTPLMREYINGILLENGLEEVRHRLTRLGTPPFEVENYFTMVSLNPEQFLSKLGSDSSEQFLLLNLLPKNLSDLYLSGDIILLNLNYWSLRPISLYIDSNTILGCIKNCNYTSKRLALKFFDIIKLLKPYISEDIVLGQFNTSFLNQFDDVAQFNKILEIIYPIMVEINNGINVLKSYLTLHFYPDFPNQNTEDTIRLFKAYIQQTLDYDASFLKRLNNPTIMYDYSSETRTNDIIQSVLKTVPLDSLKTVVFFNAKKFQLLNSTYINLFDSNKTNKIILDKILINLYNISLGSNKNDDLFFNNLNERLDQVFKLYNFKKQLVNRKLNGVHPWNKICLDFFNNNPSNLIETSIKSISFIGLNEAILHHCGIELDRIETSQKFAIKLIEFMKNIIKEKNIEEQEHFVLSQPHQDNFNNQLLESDTSFGFKPPSYSLNIIRENSNLALNEKIQLFKRFEHLLDGGSVLEIKNEGDPTNFLNFYNIMVSANLNAFRIY